MTQDMINIGIAAFGGLFGWALKTVWNAVTTISIDAMNFGVAR